MKNSKKVLVMTAIIFASFSSIAAQPIDSMESKDLTKIGVVSVSSASTLSDLEARLAKKAAKQGATYYRIISAGGNNLIFGNAIIYK
ncbi:multiple stress resistance protein BhsA [Serratia liquefaciens]|uniref:DUF1471 domain-containing protein n=1 Tax=Serratia liquefaciens TaxID=614 RepID=A0A515D5X9_SERLI|nr:YdgH/BhsA/McbA-like domain containing protein [Serratia liquefaciens]QDL35816.1 DUF1471 domain-containing protein [Serratia liquefaciens]